ncbi:YIP1 family protein [Palleronia sediminis]|uniref:YIP1 family protein n=1 Tax=Palleronia sediminis TaxID=2547833 RepID=A0A4R6AJY5_9RHOB|nr:YIP1 family protein [Palleronia sediminis]TDL83675.1 YIP1 family protein [Palleronia sediminis]
MSLTRDMVASYRAPAEALGRRMAAPPGAGEPRALVTVMLACFLIFVAQWPRLSREAFLTGQELNMLLGGALLGWLFIAPLVLYGVAGLVHLVLRAMGGRGSYFGSRMALFWALLAAAPLWLLWGLIAGFVGPGIGLDIVGIAALIAFVAIWGAGLWSVEYGRNAAMGGAS